MFKISKSTIMELEKAIMLYKKNPTEIYNMGRPNFPVIPFCPTRWNVSHHIV